uniref:Lachesin n=1 Tax=Caligus clemensi TaxID=344056 RepID=C1C1H3_CALCM|nr:Lachesin precursor [Caligus clemensi]
MWKTFSVTNALVFMSVMSLDGPKGQDHQRYPHKIQYPPFPSFAEKSSKKISAVPGSEAILSCKIQDRYNFTLSWLRHSDLHILTVEDFIFTSDQRFKAVYQPSIREYWLRIKHVRMEDSGWYECQISSKPILRLRVFLEVGNKQTELNTPTKSKIAKPQVVFNHVWTEILHDKPDMYVSRGSLINITCQISIADPSKTVFWYHKDHVISYYSMRGGVSLITDIGDQTRSSLLIKDASIDDEGTYTCSPRDGVEAKVRVFVLEEKQVSSHSFTLGSLAKELKIIPLVIVLLLH